MEIPFVGGFSAGRSSNVNAQLCQNLYPVTDQQGGKTILYLSRTPGRKLWLDTGNAAELRGYCVFQSDLYVVVGNTVYKITIAKVQSTVGTILTSTGKVYMEPGINYFMLVDGEYGYYSDGTTVAQITDADFPTPQTLAYQDGYWIVCKAGTDEFYINETTDSPINWNSLDFGTAEAKPDEALATVSHGQNVIILGAKTYEPFYNSGNTDFPFTRITGAVYDVGIRAKHSACSKYGYMVWLDNSGQVRSLSGVDSQIISTPQIDYQISKLENTSDAIGDIYKQEGFVFYVLTFVFASKTFVYEFTTGLWHTRTTGIDGGRDRGNCYIDFNNKNLVGDYTNGKIYELDLATYDDDGEELQWIRRAQVIHAQRKMMFFGSLEIEIESGVGLDNNDQGSDPQMWLRWSDNGGHTWTNELWRSMGKIGEFKERVVFDRLGASRNRIFEIGGSDPVKVVIISAHAQVTVGL